MPHPTYRVLTTITESYLPELNVDAVQKPIIQNENTIAMAEGYNIPKHKRLSPAQECPKNIPQRYVKESVGRASTARTPLVQVAVT